MPTGYTQKICEQDQSFEEFLWDAVRAMGAFIHMRDDWRCEKLRLPNSDFLRTGTKERIDSLHSEWQHEINQVDRLLAMTSEEIDSAFEAHKEEVISDYQRELARTKPVHDRLVKMRDRVAAWEPPSPDHVNFKSFMIQQLDETLTWEGRLPEKPILAKSATEWHVAEVNRAQRDVAWAKKRLEEEKNKDDSCAKAVAWIMALVESVPPPPGRFENQEALKAQK